MKDVTVHMWVNDGTHKECSAGECQPFPVFKSREEMSKSELIEECEKLENILHGSQNLVDTLRAEAQWKLVSDTAAALLELARNLMDGVNPGMSKSEVARLKYHGIKVVMRMIEEIANFDHKR